MKKDLVKEKNILVLSQNPSHMMLNNNVSVSKPCFKWFVLDATQNDIPIYTAEDTIEVYEGILFSVDKATKCGLLEVKDLCNDDINIKVDGNNVVDVAQVFPSSIIEINNKKFTFLSPFDIFINPQACGISLNPEDLTTIQKFINTPSLINHSTNKKGATIISPLFKKFIVCIIFAIVFLSVFLLFWSKKFFIHPEINKSQNTLISNPNKNVMILTSQNTTQKNENNSNNSNPTQSYDILANDHSNMVVNNKTNSQENTLTNTTNNNTQTLQKDTLALQKAPQETIETQNNVNHTSKANINNTSYVKDSSLKQPTKAPQISQEELQKYQELFEEYCLEARFNPQGSKYKLKTLLNKVPKNNPLYTKIKQKIDEL